MTKASSVFIVISVQLLLCIVPTRCRRHSLVCCSSSSFW